MKEEKWEMDDRFQEALELYTQEMSEEFWSEDAGDVTYGDRLKKRMNYIFRVQGMKILFPEADNIYERFRGKAMRMILLPIHYIKKIFKKKS